MTGFRRSIIDRLLASLNQDHLHDPRAKQVYRDLMQLHGIHRSASHPDMLNVATGETSEQLVPVAATLAFVTGSAPFSDSYLEEIPPSLIRAGERLFVAQNWGMLRDSLMLLYKGSTYDLLKAAVKSKMDRFGQAVLLVPGQHWDGFTQLAESMYGEIRIASSFETVEQSILDILRERGVNVDGLEQEEIRRLAKEHIAVIVTAIPVNPTGEIPSPMALRAFANAAAAYGIPIISDEIFAHTAHPGASFVSPGDLIVQMDGRRVSMNRLVMRITSNSKTGAAPYGYELSAAMSGDEGWLNAMGAEVCNNMTIGYASQAEIYALHTPAEYYRERAAEYARHAGQITQRMHALNRQFGNDLIGWVMPPQAGYLGAIRFAPELLAACGVTTPLHLIEYAAQVAGLKAGLVFPDPAKPELMALRVNFSDADTTLGIMERLNVLTRAIMSEVQYGKVCIHASPAPPAFSSGAALSPAGFGTAEDIAEFLRGMQAGALSSYTIVIRTGDVPPDFLTGLLNGDSPLSPDDKTPDR